MPVTHFKITELPDVSIVESKKNAGSISLNTQYPINEQSHLNFKRLSQFESLWINASFKWIAINEDGDESPETISNIVWRPNVLGTPSSEDTVITANNSEGLELINLIPVNKHTGFIEIVGVTGPNNLFSNGTRIYPGTRLQIVDVLKTIYKTNDLGGGKPYAEISYKVGGLNAVQPTIYKASVNIDSLAELTQMGLPEVIDRIEEFDVGGVPTEYNLKTETFSIDINSGTYNGKAKLTINITSDFLSLNDFNEIIINIAGEEVVKTSNEIFEVELDLDANGHGSFQIQNYIVESTAAPKNGLITIILDTIDSESSKVSPTNTLVLTSAY